MTQFNYSLSFALLILISITFGILLLLQRAYLFKRKSKISKVYIDELKLLCENALTTNDVPIGALLIYKDEIIGRGHNKVKAEKQLSQHAEIVAMENAYKNLGEKFFTLDPNQLLLISTFEPCAMCKGAIIENNIRNVVFEKPKRLSVYYKYIPKSLRFELFKSRFDAPNLQESFFMKVESYRKHFGLDKGK